MLVGIDFGLKKIGIATSFGSLAEAYKTIRYTSQTQLIKELKDFFDKEKPEKIIVGMSEGEMALKTHEFITELEKEINIPVEEYDETLSTQDAQDIAIASGMRRKKRKEMEDAIAASVMLQNYLDFVN